MTHRVAIVGAGPSGFYAADGLLRANPDLHIDIIDRLPTPLRAGAGRRGARSPGHQGRGAPVRPACWPSPTCASPAISRSAATSPGTSSAPAYDAVIVATGMVIDKKLGVPGEDLPHVWGSWRFVGWLNGHPDFRQGPDLSKVKSRGGDRQRQRGARRRARAGQVGRRDGQERHRAGSGRGDRRRAAHRHLRDRPARARACLLHQQRAGRDGPAGARRGGDRCQGARRRAAGVRSDARAAAQGQEPGDPAAALPATSRRASR